MKESSTPFQKLLTNHFVLLASLFFWGMSVWWVTIILHGYRGTNDNNLFTVIYPILSLAGGITGLIYAERWGGFKSLIGKALKFLSFGLLAQFFGQAAYTYYIYLKGVAVPYPSIGDIGYFGSVVFYFLGALYLAKVCGFGRSTRSLSSKLLALVVPILLLACSYFFFLRGYDFSSINYLKTFLDFGYPIGQAIYVSVGIIALLLSSTAMGGIMKKPILFLIFALIFQYISDFVFLYQANNGSWYVGGLNDYLYLASYFLMTIALVNIGGVFRTINEA